MSNFGSFITGAVVGAVGLAAWAVFQEDRRQEILQRFKEAPEVHHSDKEDVNKEEKEKTDSKEYWDSDFDKNLNKCELPLQKEKISSDNFNLHAQIISGMIANDMEKAKEIIDSIDKEALTDKDYEVLKSIETLSSISRKLSNQMGKMSFGDPAAVMDAMDDDIDDLSPKNRNLLDELIVAMKANDTGKVNELIYSIGKEATEFTKSCPDLQKALEHEQNQEIKKEEQDKSTTFTISEDPNASIKI